MHGLIDQQRICMHPLTCPPGLKKSVGNKDRKVHTEADNDDKQNFSCNLLTVGPADEKGMRAMWSKKSTWKYSHATSHLSPRPMRKA
jgi:hypothetical protein